MGRKVKWGVIGPGNIASKFVSDFQFVPNGEVIAVASRSKARAHEFADKFGIPKIYDDYYNMLSDDEIEAIYVATPHNFHFEQSLRCLEAGKAVLCEKPITTTLSEFQELRGFAEQKQLLMMEGMWTYFLPAMRKALTWVKKGRIGEVLHVKSDFGFRATFDPDSRLFSPKLAGGALLDIGIYHLALARLFLGDDYSDIRIRVEKATTGVDSDLSIWIEYPRAFATLHASINAMLPNKTYVIGESGYIEIPNAWQAYECALYQEGKMIEHFQDGRESFGFNYECESFNDFLLNGQIQSEIVPHQTSYELQKMISKIFVLMKE